MLPFLITFLAGCSTMIGFLFIYFKNRSNNVLISSLAFASGVMFLISIYDLIPSSYQNISRVYYIFPAFLIVSIFVVIGIIMSMLIDKYLPDNTYQESKLYRVGMISMLAIILHNIPEGISVAVPIYYSTNNKKRAFLFTLVSGMSEFLGAILAAIFLVGISTDFFMGCLYAIIAGIMMHISIYELLPSSFRYKKTFQTILFFIIGIIFMFISSLLLH